MLSFNSVHFDDFIPNWRTQSEVIDYNILVLVMEGRVCYDIGGKEFVGERGDFLFIPQGTRRAGSNHPSGPHRKYTSLFYCGQDSLDSLPLLKERKFIRFKPRNFQYLQHRFQRLYGEFREGESFKLFICIAILQELLGIIARELEKPELTPIKSKYADIVKRYLLEHYREPIEIKDLAGLIQRSPNYTIALFREVIGQSPIKYIHQLRVMEACNLLIHSDMTVTQISSYLGYYDTSYFFRIFKKYTSMSPTEFMKYGNHKDVLNMPFFDDP